MPNQIEFKSLISQDVEAGIKRINKQLKVTDTTIKSIQDTVAKSEPVVKDNSGSELERLNKKLKQHDNHIKTVVATKKEQLKLNNELINLRAKQETVLKKANTLVAKEREILNKSNRALRERQKRLLAEKDSVEKLRLTTNKLKALRDQLSKSHPNYARRHDQLTNAIKRNNVELKRSDALIGQHSRNVGNYGSVLGKAGGALKSYIGIYAAFRVVGNATKIITNFQKENSKLASILGTTRDNVQDLAAEAKRLGGSTAFSASQATQLQIELGKLGFLKGEIIESGEGILNLAAATGTELADSAALAGATLRSFSLDATEMTRVTDVLAKSTSTSALDMSKLGTALPIVGATAKNAGISLERTTALLGKLTDRGIDASTAATSLRNIFLELSNKGLTWEQAMGKINTATDKNKVAMELFGKRGATAATIIAGLTTEIDDLESALNDAGGTAQEMAEEQLDNLAGATTILKSKWEAFVLSVEDGEGLIAEAAEGIVNSLSWMLEETTSFSERAPLIFGNAWDLMLLHMEAKTEKMREIMSGLAERIGADSLAQSLRESFVEIDNLSTALLEGDARIQPYLDKLKQLEAGTDEWRRVMILTRMGFVDLYGKQGARLFEIFLAQIKEEELARKRAALAAKRQAELQKEAENASKGEKKTREELNKEFAELLKLVAQYDNVLKAARNTVSVTSKETEELKKNIKGVVQEVENVGTTDVLTFLDKFSAAVEQFKTDNEVLLDGFKQLGTEIINFGKMLLDQRIQALDREIDIQNQRIDETQRNLEIEASLKAEGFASDFQKEKEHLLELQAARDDAVKKREELQKKQELIDNAQQISSIITAVANIIAGWSNIPLIGSILGIAAAGAMVASFIATKTQVKNLKEGEIMIQGEGTETSDDIPVNVSKNESVITAKGSKRMPETLSDLNAGKSNAEIAKTALSELGLSNITPYVLNMGAIKPVDNSYLDRKMIDNLEKQNATLKELLDFEKNKPLYHFLDGVIVEITPQGKRFIKLKN